MREIMKLRSMALAGTAMLALSTPALAQNPGWYLGLGVGYDQLESVRSTNPPMKFSTSYSGDAIYVGSAGYKWDAGMRLELELGFDAHDASKTISIGLPTITKPTLSGGTSTSSALLNFIYDWDFGNRWGLSLGGGVGAADVNHYERVSGAQAIQGAHTSFAWQGIAGLNFAVNDDVTLYADYRYRTAEVDNDFNSFGVMNGIHVLQHTEHVALFGVRWYLDRAAPPPPTPPPPPPPPLPPPPVKTFIVFFDFDKSNLTDKAEEVVAEAVRTAKANGFVKVLVTGHTDTVGSDQYNQALSIRRAQSVKDEMVRDGLDGGGISIAGKSFHEPLVPTGPGVREPQNRRAVIDLGG
jgi:OOP family OmpA-OmpF porin